jgi:hypothetical protein
MVRRTETGFVIEVTTGTHPANDYTEMVGGIIGTLQAQNPEYNQTSYFLLQLLNEMMPDLEQAKHMLDNTN